VAPGLALPLHLAGLPCPSLETAYWASTPRLMRCARLTEQSFLIAVIRRDYACFSPACTTFYKVSLEGWTGLQFCRRSARSQARSKPGALLIASEMYSGPQQTGNWCHSRATIIPHFHLAPARPVGVQIWLHTSLYQCDKAMSVVS